MFALLVISNKGGNPRCDIFVAGARVMLQIMRGQRRDLFWPGSFCLLHVEVAGIGAACRAPGGAVSKRQSADGA
jgi:hypothetical protein